MTAGLSAERLTAKLIATENLRFRSDTAKASSRVKTADFGLAAQERCVTGFLGKSPIAIFSMP
jgi:hypothetical protein